MTTEAEKAAEEYANKSKDDLYKSQSPHFKRAIDPELDSLLWIAEKMAFEAGYNHALTPRKIILGQPDTYPPFGIDVLLYNIECKFWVMRYLDNENELRNEFKNGYAFWLSTPPAPQGER